MKSILAQSALALVLALLLGWPVLATFLAAWNRTTRPAGGGLIAPLFSVYPAVGFTLTIKAFAITILGGMGNLLGAFVASLIIAIVEALSVIVIPSEWQNAIAFGTMILVLLVRPNGLFGKKSS